MYDHLGPSLHDLLKNDVKTSAVHPPVESILDEVVSAMETTFSGAWQPKAGANNIGVDFKNIAWTQQPLHYHKTFKVMSKYDPAYKTRTDRSPQYSVSFASAFIARLFWKVVRVKTLEEEARWASVFQHQPSVFSAYFAAMSIELLAMTNKPTVITMAPSCEVNGSFQMELPAYLPMSHATLDCKDTDPGPDRLYVTVDGFPTIDGLYEIGSGKITLLQMTIAAKHGVVQKWLETLLECYAKRGRKMSLDDFVLVFIVPDEKSKENYLSAFAGGREFKTAKEYPDATH
jgi:hypothetical protein